MDELTRVVSVTESLMLLEPGPPIAETLRPRDVRCADIELRFLARSLASVFSAESARSSASLSSFCTLRYLARLMDAISS